MSLALASFLTPSTEYGSFCDAGCLEEEEKARDDARLVRSWWSHELHEEVARGRESVTRDRDEAGSLEELDSEKVSGRANGTLDREAKERTLLAVEVDGAHIVRRPTAPRAIGVGMTAPEIRRDVDLWTSGKGDGKSAKMERE